MSTEFRPRTYGSTLWCAFINRYPGSDGWGISTGQHDQIRLGFIRAVDQNIGTVIDTHQTLDAIERQVQSAITGEFPTGHEFPYEAFQALNEAYVATRRLHDLDVAPRSADLGPGWANDGIFEDIWRWAGDSTTPMPDLGEEPIDSFISWLNDGNLPGRGGRRMIITTRRETKTRIALILEEKLRTLASVPSARPFTEGQVVAITVENANSADVSVGERAKIDTIEYRTNNGVREPYSVYAVMEPGTRRAGVRYWFHMDNLRPLPDEDPATPTVLQVGECYTCITPQPSGANIDEGDIVKVTSLDPSIRVLRWQDGRWTWRGTLAVDGGWYVAREHLSLLPVPNPEVDVEVTPEPQPEPLFVPPTREAWQAMVDDNARLRTWQTSALADITEASRILIEEANRRSWCSEYDEIIDRANGSMSVLAFEDREQEFEVEVNWTATISGSTTVMVTARSMEDAEEQVSNSPSDYVDIGSYEVAEAARYNGADDIEFEIA